METAIPNSAAEHRIWQYPSARVIESSIFTGSNGLDEAAEAGREEAGDATWWLNMSFKKNLLVCEWALNRTGWL